MKLDVCQGAVLLRQGFQYAIGAISVVVFLGTIDMESAMKLIADAHEVIDGLSHATSGASKMLIVAGPLVAGFVAKIAVVNSSARAAIARVRALILSADHHEAAAAASALAAAASTIPHTVVVRAALATDVITMANKIAALPDVGRVVSTPTVAANTVSDKVVSG